MDKDQFIADKLLEINQSLYREFYNRSGLIQRIKAALEETYQLGLDKGSQIKI